MSLSKDAKLEFMALLFLFMINAIGLPAESVGHIQIKSEPGIQILLDSNPIGITQPDVGGLILQDVPAGKHSLKAVKEGCQPLEATIDLSGDQVLIYEFKSFFPIFETYEEGEVSESKAEVKTGKIVIQTLPVECAINIPALGIESLQKTKDKRIFDKVPEGEYEAELTALGKKVKHTIRLGGGETVRLMVNFLKEEIKAEILKAPEDQPAPSPADPGPAQTPASGANYAEARETGIPQSGEPVASLNAAPQTGEKIEADILFTDSFTGQDKTRPAGWNFVNADTMDYWYLLNGELCTGNGDDLTKYNGYSYALINAPGAESWKDYTIKCSFWMTQANGRVILISRWKDKDNHYEGIYETIDKQRFLKIQKVQGGVLKTLKMIRNGEGGIEIPSLEKGTSPANGAVMRFTVSGEKLILTLGEKATLETGDTSFVQGIAGIGQWCNFVYFDNIEVKKSSP